MNVYLGFKYTVRAKIASIKITFQNQINAIEDPDPVRMGNGSWIAYISNVYRENRNSLLSLHHPYYCVKCMYGMDYHTPTKLYPELYSKAIPTQYQDCNVELCLTYFHREHAGLPFLTEAFRSSWKRTVFRQKHVI